MHETHGRNEPIAAAAARNPLREGAVQGAGLTLILACVLALALLAFGGTEPAPAAPTAAAVAPSAETTAPMVEVALSSPASVPAASTQQAAPQDAPAVPAPLDAMDILQAHEQALGNIYETTLSSMVHVHVVRRITADDIPFGFFGRGGQPLPDQFAPGAGSGFVWDSDGHILTNHHVIEDAESVTVVFPDGQELEAEVLGSDPGSDLAVLRIDASARDLQPLPRADFDSLRVGQLALAVGNPFGHDFTLTSGIISGLGRTLNSGAGGYSIPMVVQTDAPINPGNSGGPLLDRLGRVVGINTQIASQTGVNSGVGFAVPINIAEMVAPELIEHGKYEYAWLGISGANLTAAGAELRDLPPDTRGVVVIDVLDASPASAAGLLGSSGEQQDGYREIPVGGDVIIAVEGETVREMHDLLTYLTLHTRPGDAIDLTLLRETGETATVTVTLGTRPSG